MPNTRFNTAFSRIQWLGFACLISILSTGCTFKAFQAPMAALTENPFAGSAKKESVSDPISSESFTITIVDSWGKPKVVKKPFARTIPLTEALESEGLTKRFSDMEIKLKRIDPASGKIVEMKANYDPRTNRIAIQNDYDVRANDHIVVKPRMNTPLDDITQPLSDILK